MPLSEGLGIDATGQSRYIASHGNVWKGLRLSRGAERQYPGESADIAFDRKGFIDLLHTAGDQTKLAPVPAPALLQDRMAFFHPELPQLSFILGEDAEMYRAWDNMPRNVSSRRYRLLAANGEGLHMQGADVARAALCRFLGRGGHARHERQLRRRRGRRRGMHKCLLH